MFSHDAAQYRYFGDPYDALIQVDVQLGVAQSLQNSVQMTFVLFNLTQFILGLTTNEYIIKIMRRVGTVWAHYMSDHPVECRWCVFQPLR